MTIKVKMKKGMVSGIKVTKDDDVHSMRIKVNDGYMYINRAFILWSTNEFNFGKNKSDDINPLQYWYDTLENFKKKAIIPLVPTNILVDDVKLERVFIYYPKEGVTMLVGAQDGIVAPFIKEDYKFYIVEDVPKKKVAPILISKDNKLYGIVAPTRLSFCDTLREIKDDNVKFRY